jgi:hypothetical protein
MKRKALFLNVLGGVSLIASLVIFIKWLDWKFILPLALGVAAVIFFWIGASVNKQNKV